MAVMKITLFGGFEIRLADGRLRALRGQKDRALLAYLVSKPGLPQSREKLAGLLWGDSGETQARDSLKHALARLRKSFEGVDPAPLVADRQAVRLDPVSLGIDRVTFEALLSDGSPESLEQALALYQGDLLDGIGACDPAFDDWLLVERQRLRHLAEEAAVQLMARSLQEGSRDRADAAARRLLVLDPLREEAWRALMQIHAERGEAAQALKLYDDLRKRLHRDLGVTPETETTRLFEALKKRRDAGDTSTSEAPEPDPETPPEQPLTLPDKPSIAVLAFQNLSGDPEQEYFADGIVEEIITALSRLRWLFVIARNSSFTYKGRAVDVKQIGREMGVRYILEGSVRRAGQRVRIMGRLIDATKGSQLWAESFEGDLADIFELQDRVTANVVGALAPKLEQAEIERAKQKPTASLDAYDYYLRGLSALHLWTREGNLEALEMFEKATELDPKFGAAYGMAARCLSQRKACGWVTDRRGDIEQARRLAGLAVTSGSEDAVAFSTAGIALAFVVGEVEEGSALIDQALSLNANLAMAWGFSAWANVWLSRPEIGLEHVTHAMRLSPHDPQMATMQAAMACAHFFDGRYGEAAAWAEKSIRSQPNFRIALCILAASRAVANEIEEAKAAASRLREVAPDVGISELLDDFPFQREADFDKWQTGLRLAGLS